MKNLNTLIFLFLHAIFYGQEIQFIKAENGLIVREYPNKNSKRIGKFDYGVGVYKLKETGIEISIKDEGKNIIGQWVEVKETLDSLKGYVFSGYLTSNVINKGVETDNYYLTLVDPNIRNEYWENITKSIEPKAGKIYVRNNKHKDLFKLKISDLESYDNTSLETRKVNNLKNVDEVIIIESTYIACCSTHNSLYLLQTSDKKIVQLPEITNNHCDGPEPYFDYIFPNQSKGKKDKILYAKITPNEKGEMDIEILKTYSWNGLNFNLE